MSEIPEHAASFGIFDVESGNRIASFSDAKDAEEALVALVDDDPEQARTLALVFFDKGGKAIGSRLAEETSPSLIRRLH